MADTDQTPAAQDAVVAAAQTGFDQVHADPAAAARLLDSVVADLSAGAGALVVAFWGLGRLRHDEGRLPEAMAAFERALELAGELDSRTPQIMMSQALTMALLGDHAGALGRLAEAEPHVHGAVLGRLLTQRAFILTTIGRTDAALDASDQALDLLRAEHDPIGEMRLLLNRGVTLLQVGRLREVRRDLEAAAALAAEHDQGLMAAVAAHNLGYLDFLLGRFPQALAAFAAARARYAELGSPGRIGFELDADECRLLLAAGFPEEALAIALRSIDDGVATGNVHQQADAELLAARAHIQLHAPEQAALAAGRAAALFRDAGREPWTALADYLRALATSEADPQHAIPTLQAAASTLDRMGWPAESAEVLVRLGTVAAMVGEVDLARDALSRVTSVHRRASVRVRAAAWHATALLRLLDARPAAAQRAIDAGLRVVDRHRASLGASELRARAAADGVELAELGLRLAMDGGRATDVLVAVERWRAGSLAARTATIGAADDVDHDLAELRLIGRQLHGIGDGAPVPDDEVSATLHAEARRLEQRITAATRLVQGDPRAVAAKLDVDVLRSALGSAALVEYVDLDGHIHAVVVAGERVEVVRLDGRERVLALVDHALFSIRRLASTPAEHPRAAAVLEQHRRTVADLDAALLAPLRLDADEIVIVPTGALHAVPWSALPGLIGRAGVQVSPSAAWWIGDDVAEAHSTGTLLVHGPDLPHAAAEVVAVAGVHAAARPEVLLGESATTAAALAGMERAGLAHIAAHGSFRADNPMFSALRLDDGPLFVHDLQRLAHSPRVVVLSACSAARAGVYLGDELLGTSVALLALGVRTVVAPILPVRDASTRAFAIDLHSALAAGATPQAALRAVADRAVTADDPCLVAAGASFLCIGRRERRRSGVSAAEQRRLWAVRSDPDLQDDDGAGA
ncbi:MAG: CHAT domain-containing protein [Ilumatobacteraceae bacterium]